MFDVAVIGGGVVGCAIFNELTLRGLKAVLLEKENDVAIGTSKANSGIIHAGFDCKPNTLKAKFNLEGSKIFPALAQRLCVPYKNIGALVVGNDLKKIEELKKRGDANGVPDLEILNSRLLHEIEPNISSSIKYALYAPTSAIVSPYMLTIGLCEEGILNGGKVELNFLTQEISQIQNGFIIKSKNKNIETKNIVNATASAFNEVSKLIGTETYEHNFRRGEYYLLDSTEFGFARHTIFELPNEKTKGILISPTVDGNILVGPTSEPSNTSTQTTEEGLNLVKNQSLISMPKLALNKNIRVFAGVRTIIGDDFIVEKSKLKNNVINVAGICSPGLTSAPAIANYVCNLLGYENLQHIKNIIKRKPINHLKGISVEQKSKLIESDPDYGIIICKCEEVSLAEIKQALSSPLPATTVDGVKRRVRAGMGRCQGGFCMSHIIEELAKYRKVDIKEICKDASGSNILLCDIKPNEVKL